MTSNQWDSRCSSGFYTLIEDEMFGKGRKNCESVRLYTDTYIRRYGTIWEPFEDENRIRMYLYEPVTFGKAERDLLDVDKKLRTELSTEKVKKLDCINLQHHFAEDDGTIRDFVQVWEFSNGQSLFSINENLDCIKLMRVTHFFKEAKTPFDYHVKIALRKNLTTDLEPSAST